MKFMKTAAGVLLALLMLVPLLLACNNGEKPADTTAAETLPATEPVETDPPVETRAPEPTGTLLTDKTDFTLYTKDSEMKLAVKDNKLFITSASTKASGTNMALESEYVLPAKYALSRKSGDFAWKYVGYFNYEAKDRTYDEYGLIFRFEDKAANAQYDVYVTGHYDFAGPFEFTSYLTNNGDGDLKIIPGYVFSLNVKGKAAPKVWSFKKEGGMAEGWTIYSGQSMAGKGMYSKTLKKGAKVSVNYNTNQDWNAGGFIPMGYVDYDSCGVYAAHEWTSGLLAFSTADGTGDALIRGALSESPNDFNTILRKGDTFFVPTFYFGVYDGDLDDGANVFKRWFLYNKAPSALLTNANEPLTQQDMQIGLDAASYGIQAIKWDYGWWKSEQPNKNVQWRTNEGLLEISDGMMNNVKAWGASSIKTFTDAAKKKRLTLTTYILLHDTQLNRDDVPSSLKHPNWFSNRNVTGMGRSADLGNVECVEFYKQYLLNFFKETGVTTWRSDFEPICRESNQANRHAANGKDVQYWCSVGFFDLVDYLYEQLGDSFRYESCCSGGAMKDFATMRRAVIINCDDSADYMSLRMSFYDSSYCVHPAQLQLPCNARTYDSKSQYYTGTADGTFGFRSQLVGAVMLSSWNGTQNMDRVLWTKFLPTYNSRIKPLIKYGDMYHILPRPDGKKWDGIAYINKDSEKQDKGIVMVFKPSNLEGDTKTIKLEGLDPEQEYQVKFHDRNEQTCSMTGKDIMEKGITVKIEEEVGSEWIWIRVPNKK